MTTATLTLKTAVAAPAAAKPERKRWLSRIFDAMVEARMRQAQREMERYLVTIAPEGLRKEHAGKFGQYDDIGVRFMR